jgi:hypothetical protein
MHFVPLKLFAESFVNACYDNVPNGATCCR